MKKLKNASGFTIDKEIENTNQMETACSLSIDIVPIAIPINT